jgi:thiol:disulfide interchange protein DsbC
MNFYKTKYKTMKKITLSLIVLSSALLVNSCAKEMGSSKGIAPINAELTNKSALQNSANNTNYIQKNLKPFFGEIKSENIVKTEFKGISEVILEDPISSIFVSDDGRYYMQGEIIDITKRAKIATSKRVNELKIEILNSVKDSDKIIFKAKNEKNFVNIFTDVDCPFCAKLHSEVNKLNELGITVKYLASPLASLHPRAQSQMEKIWCATDKVAAMDNYKKNRVVPNSAKCENPVASQLKVAQKLGVNGTPSIFLENGENIAGYLSAKALLKRIEASKK